MHTDYTAILYSNSMKYECVGVQKEDMDVGTKRKNTLLIISPTVSQQTLNTEAKRKKATITDKKREAAVLAELC